MSGFFRYPHTPHLAWLGVEVPREDKVLTVVEAEALLAEYVTVEEKLDGANLGLSVGEDGQLRIQNRGQYLSAPYTRQFARLTGWAAHNAHALEAELTPGLIVFGEWMTARHTLFYDRLPDWFLVFDVYDEAKGDFWSTTRRNAFAHVLGLRVAPCLLEGRTNMKALTTLATEGMSRFGPALLEGVVVRHDTALWQDGRAKLVRPGFIQVMGEHWSRRALEWNQVVD